LTRGQQFADGERLGHVVVGAQLQADDFVDFLAASGEHDDRNRGPLGFELLADVETAHFRHHHVQNDEVRRYLEGLLESLDAVERGRDLKAFELKIVAQAGDHVRLVLHNQYLCRAHELSFLDEPALRSRKLRGVLTPLHALPAAAG
jgi:hypothetical protein